MPRIRTIKPEFWQNESLAELPEHARLLAIALLNHADDKGYFLANPALVRAACFPFDEDSTNVRRSLDELSRIGYIEVRDCGGKSIGWICTFTAHQKIDRPKDSRLEPIYCNLPKEKNESSNVRRSFDECSTNVRVNESPGTGNREQGKEQGKEYSGVVEFSPTPPQDQPLTEFEFVLCDGSHWILPQQKFDEYRSTYPMMDLEPELRKAAQWLRDNPRNRKTRSGICKFLGNWLARSQNTASASNSLVNRKGSGLSEVFEEAKRRAIG